MKDFLIVLPTHSDYLGVVKNFLQLFRKNWPDCPFEVVVSITGENKKVEGVECIYNGEGASLIDCLVNVAKDIKAKYYISFLGDAFINEKINEAIVKHIFDEILKNSVEYCSLQCVRNYKKKKLFNSYLRFINNMDRYSHNFTAFVASNNFLNKEISKHETDLDFELHYLGQTKGYYFKNHLIVTHNYFNLLPSITKGKWDRANYKRLRKDNPEISFTERSVQTLKEAIVFHVREMVVSFMPPTIRIKMKHFTRKVTGIDFGVRD